MSSPPPRSDDPLAALAKAAEKAVRSEGATRSAARDAREADAAGKGRLVRAVSIAVAIALIVYALIVQGPRVLDPYSGDDPLDDPQRAKAYVAGLLDEIAAYRARRGGALPNTLELAVAENRLPPSGSLYRVEYRIEGDAPVLTLLGGAEPVTLRGTSK